MSLAVAAALIGLLSTAGFDPRLPAEGVMRAAVPTTAQASRWLLRGGVTLAQFQAAVGGPRPLPDGPGYRWEFADGALVTDGVRRANGDFVIHSWGPARGR